MRIKKGGYLDEVKNIVSPGPSVYSPKYTHERTTFNYPLTGRPKSAGNKLGPGPGSYEIRKSLEHGSYK